MYISRVSRIGQIFTIMSTVKSMVESMVESMGIIVRVLLVWPNEQLCPDLTNFGQLWSDLWPKVTGSMAK